MKIQQQQAPPEQESKQIWRSYLIFFNIQKKKNLGTLIRSAAAFNVQQIFFVDSNKNPKKKFNTFGSQGTSSQMVYRSFPSLKSIKKYCKQKNIKICGIQIMEQQSLCKPINQTLFTGSTAFMLGNQQNGMNSNQKQICDFFTFIPQYSKKTACLNVAVAGSIILYNFAINSGLKQQQIKSEKFDQEVGGKKGEIQLKHKRKLNIIQMIQVKGEIIMEQILCQGNQQDRGKQLFQQQEGGDGISNVSWFNQQADDEGN